MNQNNTITKPNQNAPKGKFIAKGHDAILKSAQDAGDTIEIIAMSGDVIVGKLLNRDKFTVTILEEDSGKKKTVYKHGIESFSIDKAAY
jgi:sRNA-binding regulator protein Hfq